MGHKGLVFVVSLLAVLPQGAFSGYSEFTLPTVVGSGISIDQLASFVVAIDLLSITLNPVLLFILMYILGRSIDLRSAYVQVMALLFFGAFIGNVFGRSIAYYTSPMDPKGVLTLLSIILQSLQSAIPVVFTGFTAASLAFLVRLKRLSTAAIPPSQP